jgi:dipeptidyl aminopeptidase/acylaminoacyl peptidase
MIGRDDLDRLLTVWLDETAGSGAPDYLDETLAGVEHLSQRPVWLSPGRWLPMDLTFPRAGVPRVVPILVLIALLAAMVAAAVLVGSRQAVPPPFGLAVAGDFVYDSGGDLYLRSPIGTVVRIASPDSAEVSGATFSRDGTRIAFWSRTDGAGSRLWVARADGRDRHMVSADVVGPVGDAAPAADWSPTGDRVAFAAQGEVYVVGIDGSDLHVVSAAPVAEGPAWSPDGRSIAFKAMADGRPAVFVVDLGSGVETRVSVQPGDGLSHNWPAWSPDGTALVYFAETGGDGDIAIARFDGTSWTERIVVAGPTYDAWPEWSNGGTRISFIRSEVADHGHVVVAGVDGQDQRQLDSPLIGWAPHCWAPDDRTIAAVTAQRGVGIGDETDPGFVVISVDGDVAPVLIPTPERTGFAACSWQRLAP